MKKSTTNDGLGAPERIEPWRLRAAGAGGADAWTWAGRACAAGAVVAALALAWSGLGPLAPTPGAAVEGPRAHVPAARGAGEAGATIDEREGVLLALRSGGNAYAADRRPWEKERAETDARAEAAEEGVAGAAATAVSAGASAGAAVSPAALVLEQDAPGAIKKRLEEIRLRGLHRSRDGWVAWIGPRGVTQTKPYRVGEVVEGGEWTVAAIDEVEDRVILGRGGKNFELRMYDGVPGAGAAGAPGPVGAVAAPVAAGGDAHRTVRVRPMTREAMAAELAAAGVSAGDIEELLAMAAAGEEGAGEKPARTGVHAAPPMPPALEQLLKAMASGDAMGEEAVEERPREEKRKRKKD